MKKLILITGLLIALSGLIKSVDAQTTSTVGYGSNSDKQIRLINFETGQIVPSLFDTLTYTTSFQGLAIDAAGENLYGTNQHGNLYRIEISTGINTPLGNMGIVVPDFTEIEAADFNIDGTELWVTDFESSTPTIYKINNFDTTDPIGNPISATPVQTVSPGIGGGVVRTMTVNTTKDVWLANGNFDWTWFNGFMDFQSIDTEINPPDTNITNIGRLDDDPSQPNVDKPVIYGMDRSDIDGELYGLSQDGGVYHIDQDSVPSLGPNNDARIELIGNTGGHLWLALAISSDSSGGQGNGNQPPVADAGDNVTIHSSQQLSTILNGIATDPDVDDSLTYRWLEGATVLLDSDVDGDDASLDLGPLPLFGIGVHTLTLEVGDSQAIAIDDMILTIDNSPPVVAPSGGGTFQLGNNITLSGSVSDFDGDGLNYRWFEGTSPDFIASFISTTAGGTPVVLPDFYIVGGLPLGNHIITLEADDGINSPVSGYIEVEVVDTTAPTISATACPCILWPPNHKMVDVEIQVTAADESGSVTLSATVESSEPPDSTGDGNTIPDFTEPVIDQDTGVITLQLRSERKGNGSGRTYTMIITATDPSGNSSDCILECVAPHDMGKK